MFEENFGIIHRSALFLVLGKELIKSKNNMPFKLGFYIFTYFLIYPQQKTCQPKLFITFIIGDFHTTRKHLLIECHHWIPSLFMSNPVL